MDESVVTSVDHWFGGCAPANFPGMADHFIAESKAGHWRQLTPALFELNKNVANTPASARDVKLMQLVPRVRVVNAVTDAMIANEAGIQTTGVDPCTPIVTAVSNRVAAKISSKLYRVLSVQCNFLPNGWDC